MGRILTAQEPYLACLLLAHDTCQVARAEAGVERSHLRTCLSEDSILRGYRQVAHQVQHMAAAYGVAVHHRYHGLRQSAYLHLHVEHAQPWHTLLVYITATALHMHVAASAEGMLHLLRLLALRHFRQRPCQQHHTDALQLATDGEGLRQLLCRPWRERITIARSIDGDLRYAVVLFQQDLLEIPDRCPFSCFHHDDINI